VKIAFIVQRFGTEILGGSEYHCRLIAERMAERHEVDVLTTCARDYVTWANEYPEGADRLRGVTVRRFANTETRHIKAFNEYSDWIFNYPHTTDDELTWLRRQGPWCPALVEYLQRHHASYDVLIFFTYLYAPTVLGLQVAPERSILVPTAHDEPAIRLGIYADVFARAAGIAFNTESERRFLLSTFRINAVGQETVGCGVDLPPEPPARRERSEKDAGADGPAAEPDESRWADEDVTQVGRYRWGPRGSAFRRRHRLREPFVLYGGRIDPGKGCEELFEYFRAYVSGGGEATLALMGAKLMPIPDERWVRFAGMLSEEERLQALEAATVVAVPSPFESLSLLALEAFAVGTPVLANARSEVLVEHCRSSNAGLWYADRDEFAETLRLLVADERLRTALGRNGKEYVRCNYRWDVIMSKYDRLMAAVRGK
jgi:glycosyltransferase involved in cell wall biosynthesis